MKPIEVYSIDNIVFYGILVVWKLTILNCPEETVRARLCKPFKKMNDVKKNQQPHFEGRSKHFKSV